MNKEILKDRTKMFAINTIKLTDELPITLSNDHIIRQLIRSATSVGANYRAALRAKSQPDFLYKIKIVLEEADECIFWLEIIQDTNERKTLNLATLYQEANELTAIFCAITKTLKSKT